MDQASLVLAPVIARFYMIKIDDNGLLRLSINVSLILKQYSTVFYEEHILVLMQFHFVSLRK